MHYRLLADALVIFHLAFIAFAILGGLLMLVRRTWWLLHVPAALWALWTEFTGTICPLTPWEQTLRAHAGQAGYRGGFVDHYLIPLIYPAGLTPALQVALGVAVLAINLSIYALVWRQWRRRRHLVTRPAP